MEELFDSNDVTDEQKENLKIIALARLIEEISIHQEEIDILKFKVIILFMTNVLLIILHFIGR